MRNKSPVRNRQSPTAPHKAAQDVPEETVHQMRYREDSEVDEYDEHKLQKMADDPTAGGDGPDA